MIPHNKKICLPDDIHKCGDQKSVFKLFNLLPDQLINKVILDVEEISQKL